MQKLIIALVFILSGVLFPQDWEWQNPLPQGNSLNDIQSINSYLGFACGGRGTILKTNVSGLSWRLLNFPKDIYISSIDFIDNNEGWAIGVQNNTGYVFKTINGGNSWEQKLKVKAISVTNFFLNKTTGWVSLDSVLYFTEDDGVNWSTQNFPQTISSIFFLNYNLGWLTAGKKIYKTTDNGNNWKPIEMKDFYFSSLNKIEFVDSLIGFVSATLWGHHEVSGYLFHSTDGGLTWKEQLSVGSRSNPFDRRSFSDFHLLNKNIGWAIAEGEIYKTYNGTNWSLISIETYLRKITVVNSLTLWGAGAFGSLFVSTDGGYNWIKSSTGVISETNDMQLIDKNNLFAAGGQTIFRTSDGGNKWEYRNIGNFGKDYFNIRAIWFIDPLHGWIGVEYTGGWGGLYKTTNGGFSWSVQIDNLHRIFDIFFIDNNTGWFFSGNEVYSTNNSGFTWNLQQGIKPDAVEIVSIYFVSENVGYAGGYIGLYKTMNSGRDWTKINLNIPDPFIKSIFFIDDQTGWAAGYSSNNGLVLKTTDGGLNWNVIYLSKTGTSWPQSINFANKNNGWVVGTVGFTGTSFHSLDGGESWHPVRLPSESYFMRVVFPDTSEGWILGDSGEILHTSIGGDTKEVAPPEYFLYQNYPNPFNSTTRIKYYVPKFSYLSVKVFNLLGEEIATLFEGYRQAGNYEVVFDGSELASGVYFCQLRADNFAETKKLLLLK